MKSEMKMPRDRDREVKFQNNSREFSRNETLAGYCHTRHPSNFFYTQCGGGQSYISLFCVGQCCLCVYAGCPRGLTSEGSERSAGSPGLSEPSTGQSVTVYESVFVFPSCLLNC